jgi:hypothetical protein
MIKEIILGGTLVASGVFGTAAVEIPKMKATQVEASIQKAQPYSITKHYSLPTNSSSKKEAFYLEAGQRLTIKKSGDTAVYYTLHNKDGKRIGQYSSSIIYTAKEDGNVYVQFHVPFVYDDIVNFTANYTIQ